ncbi:MAG TPA: hypothetical protein VI306_22315 [Pyrinomonadaceae bacterium]
MKRERPPTPEEFDKLLAWLAADREEAGQTFNVINSRLTKVFALRGCVDAESLAEEVINRVAVRIDKVLESYSDPLRCFLGFIDHVYREDAREREQQRRLVEKEIKPRPTEELEQEDQCLEDCLSNLTKTERDLVERYFLGEKRVRINNRKQLATELALTINALRIRAFHLRKQLNLCLVACLNQT